MPSTCIHAVWKDPDLPDVHALLQITSREYAAGAAYDVPVWRDNPRLEALYTSLTEQRRRELRIWCVASVRSGGGRNNRRLWRHGCRTWTGDEIEAFIGTHVRRP